MMDPDDIEEFLEACWRDDEDGAYDWWVVMYLSSREVLCDVVGVSWPNGFVEVYETVVEER